MQDSGLSNADCHRGATIMGDIPENEKKWDNLARAQGYKCEACGQLIPFGEREVYFERKLCGRCAATVDKKD